MIIITFFFSFFDNYYNIIFKKTININLNYGIFFRGDYCIYLIFIIIVD